MLIGQQSILSGEFILSVEGKVFAYLSCLLLLYLVIKEIFYGPVFFSYSPFIFMHLWRLLLSCIYLYTTEKIWIKKYFNLNFVSFLLSLPLIINLMRQNLFSNMSIDSDLINSNLINMIKIRAPHHLYPFDKYSDNLISINDQWILNCSDGFNSFFSVLFSFKTKYSEWTIRYFYFYFNYWIYLLIVFIFPFSQFTMLFPFRIDLFS